MESSDRIQQLELRIQELEAKQNRNPVDIKALWESVRDETDVNEILSKARAAGVHPAVSRAQLHGVIDDIINNPDGSGGETNLWWTPIVASSEPCGIVVATVISAAVC